MYTELALGCEVLGSCVHDMCITGNLNHTQFATEHASPTSLPHVCLCVHPTHIQNWHTDAAFPEFQIMVEGFICIYSCIHGSKTEPLHACLSGIKDLYLYAHILD